MKFTLIKSEIKGIYLPQIVFENLSEVSGDNLKVILYVVKNGTTEFLAISNNLNMTVASVISSLYFWSDKGILHLEEESESTKPRRKPLASTDIARLLPNSPEIGELSRQLQKIFGFGLNEKYLNKFIALYIEDGIPIDVILQIVSHYMTLGQDNPSYVIKVVRSWYTKLGLKTGQSVDEYLALCTKRDRFYKDICKIFGFDDKKLTTSEKTIVNAWLEKLGMSLDMIGEAFVRAGHLANIQYCNGILKAWSQKGYTSPKDLESEISNITQSSKNIDTQDDFIVKSRKSVPTFDKT